MKGIKCRLMKSTSISYLAGLLLFLVFSFCGSCFLSSSASAKELSGTAFEYWAGISNSQAPFANGYDFESGWQAYHTPTYYYNSSTSPNDYYFKNISHSAKDIQITDSMWSSGSLSFSGWVEVLLVVRNPSSLIYPISNIADVNLFNGNAFSIGLDLGTGVYDADSVTVRSIQNMSSTSSDGHTSTIRYRISFTARYNKWDRSGSYRLNWRLNGNNATNGGYGSMFAPFYYHVFREPLTGVQSYFYFHPPVNSVPFLINIAENGAPPTDPSNYDKKFDELNDSLNDLKHQNNTIIDQNQQIIDGQKEQTDAIKDQTEQQKDQYEQDKQEEADRENNQKEEISGITGLFSFPNILNPFDPFFALFRDGGCASIPILSNWFHSENSQYCSWFPQSIRSVLTPVFGIVGVMLIFGFVVRWLGGSNVVTFDGDK